MKSSILVAWSLLLIAAFGVPVLGQIAASPAPKVRPATHAITEQSIVRATNARRVAAGLAPLKTSGALKASADLKNAEMESLGYFGHLSPSGGSPWRFFKRVGYRYEAAGENLAEGHTDVEVLASAWMNSRPHRKNILSRRFTEIGASVNRGTVVVHFGSRDSP